MSNSSDYGIDYSSGTSNMDTTTHIRYGVIPMNALGEWAHEDFKSDYGKPTCPRCGNQVVEYEEEKHDDYKGNGCCDYACEQCNYFFDSSDCYGEELLGYILDDGEYQAEMGSDGIDVFVTLSPYYTYAQYCSPCAPGACNLLNSVDSNGPKAYCFGHEFFEGDIAPYPVYKVSDNSLVDPYSLLTPGYCALCRQKEIELYGDCVGVEERHKIACKLAGCTHPYFYNLN